MTAAQLIAEFETMLKEKWRYEWGAAKKGVVDCSGAFVYAFKQYGLSIYHGSNTIFRKHLTQRGKIGEITLVPGMAVFKWREDGEPDKYIADGLDDFYHIGLYAGGDRVLEARGTKAGFVAGPLKGWTHAGKIKGIDYGGKGSKKDMDILWTGTVQGGRLALRSTPERTDNIVGWMPSGAKVKVLEEGAAPGWVRVEYEEKQGYCMAEYLLAEKGAQGGRVTITLEAGAARAVYEALKGIF